MDVAYRTVVAALALDEFTIAELAKKADVKETSVRTALNRYRDCFKVEVGSSGKPGRQPQTWRLTDAGREFLESFAKNLDMRFEGPRPGPPLRRPSSNPELATADDLNGYLLEPSIDLLPLFVRHVLRRAPGLLSLDIPTGEGIRLRAEDGKVFATQASLNVPEGHSVWEFGAGYNPDTKADEDYRNRTDSPSVGVTPADTAFVFVTSRYFPNKRKWVTARKKEKVWRDVIALDATDLHAWVEGYPSVHTWLSAEMGLHPQDVRSIHAWFEMWRLETVPPVPAGVFLAGREEQVEQLLQRVRAPGVVVVRSNSKLESLAFIAAALLTSDVPEVELDLLSSALLVKTDAEWRRLADSMPEGILVPEFAGANPAIVIHRGLTVVVPLGLGPVVSGSALDLPRIDVAVAAERFVAEKVQRELAERLALEIDGNLFAFRRSRSINPDQPLPTWIDTSAGLVAPLVLLGGWDAGYPDDRKAVEEITQQRYEDVERSLRLLARREDAPLSLNGKEWQVTSPQDGFALVKSALMPSDLDRWRELASQILLEPDRTYELPTTKEMLEIAAGGRVGVSPALRSGVARAAALLGTFGDPAQAEHAKMLNTALLRGSR